MGSFREDELLAGRYELRGELGKGGMGLVVRAYDRDLRREVAIKSVPDPAATPEQRERLEREARALASLRHPGIVTVYDLLRHDGGLYLVLELVPGRSLAEQMDGPHPWPDCARLGMPLCAALDYAHRHGVVHRDITPANIVLDEDGSPRLTDFGLARGAHDARLTEADIVVGTAGYMAPEQIRGDEPVPESDVYSLCVVLFEFCAGRRPYEARTRRALEDLHLGAPVPDLADYADVPPQAAGVLHRGMQKQAGARCSASVLGAALERTPRDRTAVRPGPDQLTGAAPVPPRAGRRRARSRRVGAVAAVAVCAAGAVAVGVVVGAHGSDAADASVRSARSGAGLRVGLPSQWTVRQGLGSGLPGLAIQHPLVATAPGGGEIVAGITAADGPTLLPEPFRRTLTGAARAERVRLGAHEALRYRGLRPRGIAEPLTVYALPTSRGVATIACLGDGAAAFAARCERVAASLGLPPGTRAYPAGPRPAYADALRNALDDLNRARAQGRARLRAASGAQDQRFAAEATALSVAQVRRELARAPVSPRDRPAHTALLGALDRCRAGYAALAGTAAADNASSYRAAASRIGRCERGLAARLEVMSALGYHAHGAT